MQTLYKVASIFNTPRAIFRIPTANRGDVYLSVDRPNYQNDVRAVVEVRAVRFLELWRQPYSSHKDVAHGTPTTWPSDYKFHWAEDGFKWGEENPVPLAEVNCYAREVRQKVWRKQLMFFKKFMGIETSSVPALTFTNGVTRTIWLLTAGATVFPVQCHKREAALLHELAGVPGEPFRTVDTLIPANWRDELVQ